MHVIDREEVKRIMQHHPDAVVIETLPEEAFAKEHIPGAVNVPVDAKDFDEQINEVVPNKRAHVVVYCANTQCNASPRAAQRLEALGYEHVYDYEAGKKDWKKAGFQIEASH